MKYQSFLSILTLILLSFAFIPVSASAQISSGIATYVQINDKDVQEGDVIKVTPKGYRKTTTAYEPSVFGVVTDNPSVSFENKSLPNGTAVISSGKVYVRVSGHNGPISKGDTLTTSIIPGVAQKATENGYVIGTAVESFPASKNSDTGKVLVVLNITYNSSLTTKTNNLFKLFTIAADAPYLSPLNALRYLFAGIMVLTSFVIAVFFFGRVSTTGVEAIGRNPLAGKLIMASVVLHLLLAAGIIIIGVAVGYIILVL
jgi:F0F1-type ATP synthase membrane subunit c/vacuolar-type H+-ATPase subunit K